MATFVVAHGAWSAGWAWKKMHPLMAARGHSLVTPTFTGLGERGHLARAEIDLETHIADILGVLKFEDLSAVNLIGHSYGGMVATGVADRARERIAKLIYIDALRLRTATACSTRCQHRRARSASRRPTASFRRSICRLTPPRKIACGALRCGCRSRPRASSRN